MITYGNVKVGDSFIGESDTVDNQDDSVWSFVVISTVTTDRKLRTRKGLINYKEVKVTMLYTGNTTGTSVKVSIGSIKSQFTQFEEQLIGQLHPGTAIRFSA